MTFHKEREVNQEGEREVNQEERDMLNSIMAYIRNNHPDAKPFIEDNMEWMRSKMIILPGNTRSIYIANGWTVYISHSATKELFYGIRAEYSNENKIVWIGEIRDGIVTEKSYSKIP
jgi:hypothetical protein